MSLEPNIILYDLSSGLGPRAWSPSTWKARFVLNYKRLPYKTIWISFPDIQATMKSIGGASTGITPDGDPFYTLPAIVDTSSGSPIVITDSLAIAEYLDATYPDRPVFPKDGKALEYAFEEAFFRNTFPHIRKLLHPSVWKILDDRSKSYFRDTKERWHGNGKAFEEWSPEGPTREEAWEVLKQGWDKLASFLDKNGPGVHYVAGGSHPTRADFIIASHIAWIVAILPEDWDKRVRHWSGGRWERLWKLTEEWRIVH